MRTLLFALNETERVALRNLGKRIIADALGSRLTTPTRRPRLDLDASPTLAEVNARRPGGER